MSDEKRRELIEAGKLNEDGTRVPVCPLCGQTLPEGFTLPDAAVVETVEAEVVTENEAEVAS